MRSAAPSRLVSVLLLGLLVAGCPASDSSSDESGDGGKQRSSRDASVAPADWPSAPLDVGAAPLTGANKLPLGVRLEGADGKSTTLGKLLAGNSIVVYVSPDTTDRQNKAAARALRQVADSGGPAGFRLLIVFTEGTTAAQIDDWYRKRKVRRAGRAAIDAHGEFAQQVGWAPRSLGLVGEDGSVALTFGPTEEWASRLGFEGGPSSDLLFAAWALADTGPKIDAATRQAAGDVVRAVLAAGPDEQGGLASTPLVSVGALAAPSTGPVYVSLYRTGVVGRLRGVAEGGSLGEAVVQATLDALSSGGPGSGDWRAALQDVTFAIDLAGAAAVLPTRAEEALWYLVEPGLHGVIVSKGEARGVVLPHEAVTQGLLTPRVRNRTRKWEATVKEACQRAGIGVAEWTSEAVTIERFHTTSFGVAVPGGSEVVSMVRGTVPMEGPPDEARILESLRIGGRWLEGTVQEDGKFSYEYFPNADETPPGYNIVRHAGSVYGLFEMFHLASTEPVLAPDAQRYLDAAARSMGFVYDATEVPEGDTTGLRRCLIDGGRCQSGSAALTLLTFLARPKPEQVPVATRAAIFRDDDAAIMEGLGLALLDMIDDRGKVFERYDQAMANDRVDREPLYYPGETMLALLRFYEATNDARWLEGARRIGDRQVAAYRSDRFEWPDHWVMQGWYPLWKATKDPAYAEVAWRMAIHSVTEHYGPVVWTPFPDYHGAWRREDDLPRTTRAGSRLEALRGVVHLAWAAGEDARVWEDALLTGTDHLIEKQYRPGTTWYLPFPEKVLGAYPMGIVDNHVRIDNNQHALVGMVGALEVLRRRAGQ